MNNLPNLTDLNVFYIVAKKKSFAAAADELNASPAYVSKRIRILEETLNSKLFHRSTRHISLTGDGKLILERVFHILNEFEKLEDIINNPEDTPKGKINMVSNLNFGRTHVAPILAKLMVIYPELEIQFNTIEQTLDLIKHNLDLDICVGDDIPPSMIAKKLLANHRILCAAPHYIKLYSEPDDLHDLSYHSILATKQREQSSKVWRLRSSMEEVSVAITPRFISNSSDIIKQLAIEGRGIMLCSVWDVIEEIQNNKLQHVLPHYWQNADIWAVYPSRLKSSSALKTCILFIQNELLNRLQVLNTITKGEKISMIGDGVEPPPDKVFI